MTHKPRGFVAARSEHAMNLVSAHALLGVEHQEDDLEPFAQRVVGVLKYRTGKNGKAIAVLLVARYFAAVWIGAFFAALAEIVERTRFQRVRLGATTRANDHTIGPALGSEKGFASLLIGEALKQLTERHRFRIHDEKHSASLARCQIADNSPLSKGRGLGRGAMIARSRLVDSSCSR